MMTRKTAANLIVMIVAMFLMALILTPTLAYATGKPEPVTPAPTSSTVMPVRNLKLGCVSIMVGLTRYSVSWMKFAT